MKTIKLTIPIKIESEANLREHWSKKHKRKVAQQKAFCVYWRSLKPLVKLPCKVIFTRFASRLLDSDNLAGGFKAVRDSFAKEIGIDDGSELLEFEYRQEKLSKREYYFSIEVLEPFERSSSTSRTSVESVFSSKSATAFLSSDVISFFVIFASHSLSCFKLLGLSSPVRLTSLLSISIGSKTSIEKYVAMQECACEDNRAHGLFQFYGASRTGRWAGRLIQLQNLGGSHNSQL